MARAQIHLGDEELALLDRAERDTGASRSELIRRAVRSAYGRRSVQGRIDGLRESAGSWSGERPSGAEYVEQLRGDLNERLTALGL